MFDCTKMYFGFYPTVMANDQQGVSCAFIYTGKTVCFSVAESVINSFQKMYKLNLKWLRSFTQTIEYKETNTD